MDEAALDAARASCRERAWRDACERFRAAGPMAELPPAELESWAVAAHLTGEVETAGAAWAAAHHGWLGADDPGRAVRCAFWLGLTLVLRGEQARGGGWFARAGRMLGDCPPDAPEQAYLMLPGALQTMEGGDPRDALVAFADAATVGDRSGDADLATLGRLGQGQCLVRLGRGGPGTAMLDEAMLAVTEDEVSPVVAGVVYCAVILTCRAALDLGRAQQWTTALTEWCDAQQGVQPFRGQCLVHRSQLLQLRGRWDDALAEAQRACAHLAQLPGDPVQGMAYYQLGELERVRGRFDRADEAYREAHRWGHTVQPGVALLRLAQGRADDAAEALHRAAVDDEPRGMDRAHVLAACVEVAAVRHDRAAAREAVRALEVLSGEVASPYLAAIRDHATGVTRIEEGDPVGAVAALRSARTAWHRLDAPGEAARSSVYLGAAYAALGDDDAARWEWGTVRRRLTELDARTDLARLDELSGGRRREGGALTGREVEVLVCVAAGKSNRQIAGELTISEHTVRRHVQNIFTKLGLSSRSAATAWAYQHDVVGPGAG